MGESESPLLISAIESSVRMIGAGEKVRLQFPARALSFAKPIRRSTSSCNAKREPTSSFNKVKFNKQGTSDSDVEGQSLSCVVDFRVQ